MRCIALVTALGSSLGQPASAEPPASALCDDFDGLEPPDRAVRIARFARETDPLWMAKTERAVLAYCRARERLGHDLPFDPLERLRHALMMLASDCSSVRWERERAERDAAAPRACSDLSGSYRALLAIAHRNEPRSQRVLACVHARVDQLAAPLMASCEAGELSLAAAAVELGERVARECGEKSR